MTTYPKKLLTDAISNDEPLRPFQITYFIERFRNRLHAEVLKIFRQEQSERGLTKADIARRLGKRPEQITRWLSVPSNWTLDTVAELMLAMRHEPTVGSVDLVDTSKMSNYHHDLALHPRPQPTQVKSSLMQVASSPNTFKYIKEPSTWISMQ